MIAIIPAAGDGTRMGELGETPKCLMKVGEETVLERTIRLCDEIGIQEIIIIIGYKSRMLRDFITKTFQKKVREHDIRIILNEHWLWTNNVYSLWLAREYMEDNDFLIINSDIVFNKEALRIMTNAKGAYCMAVNGPYKSDKNIDIKILCETDTSNIFSIGREHATPSKEQILYESADMVKVDKVFVPTLLCHMSDAILEVDPTLNKFKFEQYMVSVSEKLQLINIKENSKEFDTSREYKRVIKTFI